MTKEEARKIRGKEICFLNYYFYPWLDKTFPDLDVSKVRRVAMAIATLANCDAKAVEQMIQLRNISVKEGEDNAWKAENNIYPHRTTWHEKVYCMWAAECPASQYRRRVFCSTLTHPREERKFLENEPVYKGNRYAWGPVLHSEHWLAIEKIMVLIDRTLTTFPTQNWWTYDEEVIEDVES